MNIRLPLLLSSVSLLVITSQAALPAWGAPATLPRAQAMNNDTIRAIRIEGNQRIEEKTILLYLGLKPGSLFTSGEIDQGLKNLFSTGFFADVKLVRSSNDLVVRVIENPTVNRVAIEGNKRVDTKDLEKELELKPRSIYTRNKVMNDTKRLLDIYRRGGRYTANVEPKLIQLDQNRVDVVYEVTEGAIARVVKVNFIGNHDFDGADLRKAIRTEETRWYKLLTDDDKYDPDRLLYDQELLRKFYVSQGYADFQVKSAHAELSPEKDAFYVTFVVEEGPVYNFGKVDVQSELKGKDTPEFGSIVTTSAGDIYDASKVEETIDGMIKELGNRGYAFVDVQPKLSRDRANKLVDLAYVIKPGPRVYVERINITGNVRTLDEVIRREFRLAEGDPYNAEKLSRTEQRLNNLGYFEKVKVSNEQGSAPDKTVINVDLQEKSTGEINVGAGFSSTDGILGDIGVKENNLLGRGQQLSTRLTIASRRKQAELGFTEPYFLNRELSAGFDLYRTNRDFSNESSYDIDLKGVTLRMGYSLQEHLQHNLTYSLRESSVNNVQPGASRYIIDQQGSTVTSAIGQAFSYDRRNNRLDPTRGYYLRFTQELAGLGGDSRYLKHEAKASWYYQIAPKWVFSTLGTAGNVFGLSSDGNVRINDRFFIGGDDFRGFRNAGIGPRDIATRDALGGNNYYTGTLEQRFPLGLPEEIGLSGAAFMDAGSLWGNDSSGSGIFDVNKLRVSAGVGLLWNSPFGPVRVDFSTPLVKDDNDLTELFRFSFGTRF